jgi:aminoglycoside phosphotransferase (APT) family kinase protein
VLPSLVQVEAELEAILSAAFPGARVESCTPLSGGVSARAVVVELHTAQGQPERVVVRRPTRDDASEVRSIVEREQAVLSRLPAWGVPGPRLRHVDFERGALVLDHVEGATDLAPPHRTEQLEQMAQTLASIHRAPFDAELATLLKPVWWSADLRDSRELDASLDEAGLRAALERFGPPQRTNAPVFLHGDYWPGNIVWRAGQLAAVLDWESAKLGDPLWDLAVARLDLLWVFGERAMRELTDLYRACTKLDFSDLARWDLLVALRPMGQLARWATAYGPPPLSRPDIDERHLRAGHRAFVRQALESLAHGSSAKQYMPP